MAPTTRPFRGEPKGPQAEYIAGMQQPDIHDPHHVFWIAWAIQNEVTAWCVEQFGLPRLYHPEKFHVRVRDGRWWNDNRTILVFEDSDAVAFRMRWC